MTRHSDEWRAFFAGVRWAERVLSTTTPIESTMIEGEANVRFPGAVIAFGKPVEDPRPSTSPTAHECNVNATEVICTLVDANARLSETISAQADQIVVLARGTAHDGA